MIEQELRALGIEFPPEPDLAAAVAARLERRRRPLWLVPALAVVAAAAALLAIPQTRAAILDLLRIGGVTVERVETQPRTPVRAPELGPAVTLADARRLAGFELLVPARWQSVHYDDPIVSFRRGPLVLAQWRGEQLPYFEKQVGPRSEVRRLTVRGAPGVWITGASHDLVYRPRGSSQPEVRVRRGVGNVLIWEQGGVTYRLEGAATLADARALARELRRP